jgi:hypothetical protein
MIRRWTCPALVLAVLVPAVLLPGCDQQSPEDSFSVEVRLESEQGTPVEGASVGVRPCYTLGGEEACGSDAIVSGIQQAGQPPQTRDVDLTVWTVEAAEDAVLLTWTTASETNNSGFRIERKTDTTSFAEIAFVDGQDTTEDSTDYSYRDENVVSGLQYRYRLIAVGTDGSTSVVGAPRAVRLPEDSKIGAISPNPFGEATTLRVQLPASSTLQSTVHTLDGTEVRTIVDGTVSQGVHQFRWPAGDLPDGLYEHRTHLRLDGEIAARDTTYAALARNTPNAASLGTTGEDGRVSTTSRIRFPSFFDVPTFAARDTNGNRLGTVQVATTVEFVVTTSEAQYTYRRPVVDEKNTFTLTVPP